MSYENRVLDVLEAQENEDSPDEPLFQEMEIRNKFLIKDLGLHGSETLAIYVEKDSRGEALYISWCLFQFNSGNDGERLYNAIWYGDGFAGSLRECRHSFFGTAGNGYLFCAPLSSIAQTAIILREYFD